MVWHTVSIWFTHLHGWAGDTRFMKYAAQRVNKGSGIGRRADRDSSGFSDWNPQVVAGRPLTQRIEIKGLDRDACIVDQKDGRAISQQSRGCLWASEGLWFIALALHSVHTLAHTCTILLSLSSASHHTVKICPLYSMSSRPGRIIYI